MKFTIYTTNWVIPIKYHYREDILQRMTLTEDCIGVKREKMVFLFKGQAYTWEELLKWVNMLPSKK